MHGITRQSGAPQILLWLVQDRSLLNRIVAQALNASFASWEAPLAAHQAYPTSPSPGFRQDATSVGLVPVAAFGDSIRHEASPSGLALASVLQYDAPESCMPHDVHRARRLMPVPRTLSGRGGALKSAMPADDPLLARPAPCACAPCGIEDSTAGNDVLSKGSVLHHEGRCTPCKFKRSRRGCKDGPECNLCHWPHPELTYSGMRRIMHIHSCVRKPTTQMHCERVPSESIFDD